MTRRLLLATAALCALAALGPTARADTVAITSGFAAGTAAGFDNPFTVDFAGNNFSLQGRGETFNFGASNVRLPHGQTVTSSASFSLNLIGPGSATYNGVSYTQIQLVNSSLTSSPLTFTLPPAGGPFASTAIVPFTMTGVINAVDFTTGAPLFSVDLTGSGFAVLTLLSFPDGVLVTDVTFIFTDPTAVPEPATLALLGAGLGGLALKRRRRKRA